MKPQEATIYLRKVSRLDFSILATVDYLGAEYIQNVWTQYIETLFEKFQKTTEHLRYDQTRAWLKFEEKTIAQLKTYNVHVMPSHHIEKICNELSMDMKAKRSIHHLEAIEGIVGE